MATTPFVLYHGAPTRSGRVLIALEELGVKDYEVKPVDYMKGEHLVRPRSRVVITMPAAPAAAWAHALAVGARSALCTADHALSSVLNLSNAQW